ncbi:hypothetical protein P691DRAFT_338771 [Macrolepiota fuliginosa MF-IS2]|uniref:Uncharacterized protein n=1 Tax=Macrolepiota fuliginosa MF-IS2 TaxID=1400762 RepID=A0A9P5XL25_9AGAR|nr:hypothetical protein P691DRAFT_338771 [Macrolepiota fuliginosa MF-IS2]
MLGRNRKLAERPTFGRSISAQLSFGFVGGAYFTVSPAMRDPHRRRSLSYSNYICDLPMMS